MKNNINNYFVGTLFHGAKAFDVARIKLVYNFTLFFYFVNLLGCLSLLVNQNYFSAIGGFITSFVFTISILFLLRRQKLMAAIFTFLGMHLFIGVILFLVKKGHWGILDTSMMIVLIVFAFFTIGRKWGVLWISYLFVTIAISLANDYSGGRILSYESKALPEDPKFMILLPCLLIIYILWVYLKAKENAEVQIETQQQQLKDQHLQLTDSLNYGRRLQEAILPADLQKVLPDSFVLFKPKDIVSGDFYWAQQINDVTVFAAVDCTGHGVPGAMVSMIGNNGLNKCVHELALKQPGEILDNLSNFVETTFTQSKHQVQDGMDLALCCLSLKNKTLEFSGANNPLYHIRNGELNEIKANKQPIGKYENRKPYSNHSIEIMKGDCFYVFTDGFADQFGGPKAKKFKYKPFKELLLSIHQKPMSEQRFLLDEAFEKWRGKLEQVDDVCVIGIRI